VVCFVLRVFRNQFMCLVCVVHVVMCCGGSGVVFDVFVVGGGLYLVVCACSGVLCVLFRKRLIVQVVVSCDMCVMCR
jgi:hypothetical protein